MTQRDPVAQLKFATSVEFEREHEHFVQVPVRPGPQACLIELRQPDGTVQLTDSIIVLPRHVKKSKIDEPVYAAYLRLIQRTRAKQLTAQWASRKIQALARKSCDQPPFACTAQEDLRQRIFHALEDSKIKNREQAQEIVNAETRKSFWHPRHLEMGRTVAKAWRSWLILAAWATWEEARLPWLERLEQHYLDLGKALEDHPSQKKDALRNKCKHLGLKKGELSPFQRDFRKWSPRAKILPSTEAALSSIFTRLS